MCSILENDSCIDAIVPLSTNTYNFILFFPHSGLKVSLLFYFYSSRYLVNTGNSDIMAFGSCSDFYADILMPVDLKNLF